MYIFLPKEADIHLFRRKKLESEVRRVVADLLRHQSYLSTTEITEDEEGGYTTVNYRDMLTDPEVSAALAIRLTAAIPGLSIVPPDDDPRAEQSADLVNAVIDGLPGSPLDLVRNQMYREAMISGLMVAEPIQKVMTLTGLGKVIGLADIKTVRGSDIELKVDPYGTITGFQQTGQTIDRDKLLYYAYHGEPSNRRGVSVLRPAYAAWDLKVNLRELYAVFAQVNAAGMRIASIPDNDYLEQAPGALARLKALSKKPVLVKPKSHELDFQMPGSAAGMHFVKGIKDLCNAEIRKTILYDETFNSEGQHTGSYASSKVSQDIVYEAMAAEGFAFLEDVIREQLFRRILEWNGMGDYPVPLCIPEPESKKDADLGGILTAIAQARTQGLITIDLPETVQEQIVHRMLDSAGVSMEFEAEPQVQVRAAAPRGRQRSDILKLKKEADRAEDDATMDLVKLWEDDVMPSLKSALNGKLFDGDTWKTKNPGTIRKILEETIPRGGSKIRSLLTEKTYKRFETGMEDAEKILPVRGKVSVGPMAITPTYARSQLSNSVYFTLQKCYGDITQEIYHILDNAIVGQISTREAMAQISQHLAESGFTEGVAHTIARTSLAQAYNGGRMAVYGRLSDPDGTQPGGIIGYQYSAVMDDYTTEECQDYNGRFFRVDDPSLPEPPIHYNCRSVLVPVFTGEEPWDNGQWTGLDESQRLASNIPTGFGGN